jgi:uncharacterized protein YcfJ
MGVIGQKIGEFSGSFLGGAVGKYVGGSKGEGIGKKIGSNAGSVLGSELIPFRYGGMVKPPKGRKTMVAILHKNELVVPASMVKNVSKKLKSKIAKKGGRNMKI